MAFTIIKLTLRLYIYSLMTYTRALTALSVDISPSRLINDAMENGEKESGRAK